MTREEKAGLLLVSLPPDVADSVLARMSTPYRTRLRDQMTKLRQAPEPREVVDEVLGELDDLLRQEEFSPRVVSPAEAGPAADAAHSAGQGEAPSGEASAAPQPAERERAEDLLLSGAAEAADPLAALQQLPPDRLAPALQGENPRTVCLILNFLEPVRAGEILKRLPPEMRRDVSIQLGQAVTSSRDVAQRVARAILLKSRNVSNTTNDSGSNSRFKRMADMLRQLDKPERMEVLAALEQNDPAVATGVKEFLYQFEDLLAVEDRSLQKLLAEVDSKNLALALKGASEPIKDKILNNLSKRARETLAEEMDFLGVVPTAQLQQAQKVIVETLQRLDQAGELVMLNQ